MFDEKAKGMTFLTLPLFAVLPKVRDWLGLGLQPILIRVSEERRWHTMKKPASDLRVSHS